MCCIQCRFVCCLLPLRREIGAPFLPFLCLRLFDLLSRRVRLPPVTPAGAFTGVEAVEDAGAGAGFTVVTAFAGVEVGAKGAVVGVAFIAATAVATLDTIAL